MVGRDKDKGLQLPPTTAEAHISGTIKEGLGSYSQTFFPNKYLSGSTMLFPEMPGTPADHSTATSVKKTSGSPLLSTTWEEMAGTT